MLLLDTPHIALLHTSVKYTLATNIFLSSVGKKFSASSTEATQKIEKERKADKPAENKVYWGTHACVALEPTDSKNPFISQSNLKLLTNFNCDYDEEYDDENINDDSSNIEWKCVDEPFDNLKENDKSDNGGEISKNTIRNFNIKKSNLKNKSNDSDTVKKSVIKRSYR